MQEQISMVVIDHSSAGSTILPLPREGEPFLGTTLINGGYEQTAYPPPPLLGDGQ